MRSLFAKLLAHTLFRPSDMDTSHLPPHDGATAATRPVFRAPPLGTLPTRRPLSAAAHQPRLRPIR